ncbi:hypothetical protein HNY73_005502 [Argiope bruennichi]|uniref:G-protein coupled receptors family 1 profile domain-containing protein n=1 Tax=Argiope bruennichi TaxID=94029 RepID=A0A8T0FJB9_ARGBR|nr:hypothetical protein HNY73_005502 [Argiope bruennichi]
MPHDYLVTFSPLTVHVILPGILLIVIVQVTGPLYGWGKYDFVQETGLCGITTESPFGCSYAIYLVLCLILPPLVIIAINGILLLNRIYKKRRAVMTPKRNIAAGNSNFLDPDKEVPSLVIFILLLIVFSLPRSIFDIAVMCEGFKDLQSILIFPVYFIDSLLNILLPVICLAMHPRTGILFWHALQRRRGSTAADIEMSTLNV